MRGGLVEKGNGMAVKKKGRIKGTRGGKIRREEARRRRCSSKVGGLEGRVRGRGRTTPRGGEGSKAEVHKDGEGEGGSGRPGDFPTKPINKKVGEVGAALYIHVYTYTGDVCAI